MTEAKIGVTMPEYASGPGPLDQSYFSSARQLLPALVVLSKHGPEMALPVALLAGQAVENALSSYLFKLKTHDDNDLKKLHHNLVKMWECAHEARLRSLPKDPPTWLKELSQGYAWPFPFRYAKNINVMAMPDIETLATEVPKLVEEVAIAMREDDAGA